MWPGEILGYFKNGELSNSLIQGVRGIGGGLEPPTAAGHGRLSRRSIVVGEYSCRCHGKRVISAPSKPLKLKLAGHIL